MLFDWLLTGQIVPFNPASSVRGPKHVVKKGKTLVLSAEDGRRLLDSNPLRIGQEPKPGEKDTRPPDLIGLGDRAMIGVMETNPENPKPPGRVYVDPDGEELSGRLIKAQKVSYGEVNRKYGNRSNHEAEP
jgi:hypothetical protein